MPIYEYECRSCGVQFQQIIMNRGQEEELVCPACGNRELKKLISRVSYHTSEQDRLDAFDAGSTQNDDFFKDTRNIGLAAKKRAREMGVSLGDGFEAKLERIRTDPGSVIKDSE